MIHEGSRVRNDVCKLDLDSNSGCAIEATVGGGHCRADVPNRG